MAVIADLSLPPDALALAGVFEAMPDAGVVFEAIVPVGESAGALFWVEGDDTGVTETLRDRAEIETLTRFDARPDRTLFHGEFESGGGTVVGPLAEAGVHVLTGGGDDDGWQFRVLCRDRRTLSKFTERVTGLGIPVTLDRVSPYEARRDDSLSEKQEEAVLSAYEEGYFAVPRRATIEDLASGTDISDSAFSQRLRRGLRAVIEESLTSGPLGPGTRTDL